MSTKKQFIYGISFCCLLLLGCANSASNSTNTNNAKINIVTSFYPLYDIATKVGGNLVNVKNLVQAGSEPHDYEPSPQDIVALNQAQLIIYNGAGMETWTDKIIPDLEKSGIQTINESENFKILNGDYMKEETGATLDPHIWMDPIQYKAEVQAVDEKLEQIDPANKKVYKTNADKFIAELNNLNEIYITGLANCKFKEFVTNHAAFGYLSKRYNITMIPIAGLSPDSEPSPKTMANLTDLIKAKGIKYILTETLVSPKIAETIANETGTKTLIMNPLEGLSNDEISQGKDYIAVMKDNLKSLQTALECK